MLTSAADGDVCDAHERLRRCSAKSLGYGIGAVRGEGC
jgi:hypothetical protein